MRIECKFVARTLRNATNTMVHSERWWKKEVARGLPALFEVWPISILFDFLIQDDLCDHPKVGLRYSITLC